MFLVQAIADFDPEMILGQQSANQTEEASKDPHQSQKLEQKLHKHSEPQKRNVNLKKTEENTLEADNNEEDEEPDQQESDQKHQEANPPQQPREVQHGKRLRPQQHEKQLQQAQNEQEQINYIAFKKGDKIVTRQTFDNGWWFGNVLKKPDVQGFFPSNFVKVGTTAPLPQAPLQDPKEKDWMKEQLGKMGGPVKSQYYQGITGYKMVKIDDKNKNILKGNYVKFDSTTGLAKIPIKSQEPAAKAVRQMGYYFDYHDWCEQKNANPTPKSRPDPRKKRKKRLNLILFGQDKIKRTKKQE